MIDEMIARTSLQHRLALGGEIRRVGVAGARRDLRTPFAEKCAHRFLLDAVAMQRRIGDPKIDLECAVAAGANFRGPTLDRFGLH